ncbi:hypothetical protein NQZ68_028648 [Dissostichus eleginoides]|nr:hypothetical protein NQZ68_028648 [Dissostichus eleginoides]
MHRHWRYACDRVSLCKASSTRETRALLTARPRDRETQTPAEEPLGPGNRSRRRRRLMEDKEDEITA